MLPVECIVRGYITGSGWANYKVCGITPPEGRPTSRPSLSTPPPPDKWKIGHHDETSPTSRASPCWRSPTRQGRRVRSKLRDYTIALYKKCAAYSEAAASSLQTPSSSLAWTTRALHPPASGCRPSAGPRVSLPLTSSSSGAAKANPDSNYDLPQEVIDKTIAKYEEAYQLLTGNCR